MPGTSSGSGPKTKLSRRKFLLGSVATAASAAVTVNSERANAFFNTFGFMKKSGGNSQTSNGYTIGQSLRFTAANSAYLSRTPTAVGNRQTWTYSFWTKRADSSLMAAYLCASADTSNFHQVYHQASSSFGSNLFIAATYSYADGAGGTARDPSAWMHCVVAFDTTQTTQTNRVRYYINGSQVSLTGGLGTYIAQNSNAGFINNTQAHYIMRNYLSAYCDAYMAEVIFVDGQALDPSYFGQVDTNTGQWIPKAPGVSDYGKNGYYLTFSNGGNLGADSAPISGTHTAANNWTPNGVSAHDQVLDSPTNNFPILSPIDADPYPSYRTISSGNLAFSTANGTYFYHARATCQFPSTSKWYWEGSPTNCNAGPVWGIVSMAASAHSDASIGFYSKTPSFSFRQDGYFWVNGVNSGSYTALANNDTAMFAFDPVNGFVWVGKNGTWFNSGNPANGTGYIATTATGYDYGAFMETGNPSAGNINFGQGGQTGLVYNSASGGRFKYTPPAGFNALCTANLPAPAIKRGSATFQPLVDTGANILASASAARSGWTEYIELVKNRTSTNEYFKLRFSDDASNMLAYATTNAKAAFTAPVSGDNYNAHVWRVGASYGCFTQEISHTTGADTQAAHGLGSGRFAAILKSSAMVASDWWVYHPDLPSGYNYRMNLSTAGKENAVYVSVNDTLVTIKGVNPTGTYRVVVWRETSGFSRFGKYTSNGSADGPFIFLGFKPSLLITRPDRADHGMLLDAARSPINPVVNFYTLANYSQENDRSGTGVCESDFVSNGFKIRCNHSQINHTSTTDYYYLAFAETPFKYATAR